MSTVAAISSSQPESPLPLPRNPRYRTLDMWRGVACLLVVIGHSSLYAKLADPPSDPVGRALSSVMKHVGIGFLGVPMFFVISGYCIAATADSTRRKPGVFRRYFARRLRRIYPPYWAALAGMIVFILVVTALAGPDLLTDGYFSLPQPATLNATQWLGNVTLTETWRPYVFGDSVGVLQMGPAYTLCYEEQFYIVCGLILLFAPRRFFLGVGIVSLLTIVLLLAGKARWGLFVDGMWLHFAAGVAVYYWVNYATRAEGLLILALLVIPTVAGLVLWPVGSRQFKILVLGGAPALLFMALHRFDGAMSQAAVLKPLHFCGKMCYSMYLVHIPITKFSSHVLYLHGVRSVWETMLVTVPVTTAVTVFVAWIFYNLVERHFLNPPSAIAAPATTGAIAVEQTGGTTVVEGADEEDVKVPECVTIPEILPTP